jgi:hypothetical protein
MQNTKLVFSLTALALIPCALRAETPQSPVDLARKAQRLGDTIYNNARYLSRDDLEAIDALIDEAGRVATGRDGRSRLRFAAECHIDNDIYFTYDYKVAGVLTMDSVEELSANCNQIARASYGNNSSSGLQKLQVVGRLTPSTMVGQCHIDNDIYFTEGYRIIGSVAGSNVQEMLAACDHIAKTTYKQNSSSGVRRINEGRQGPGRGFMTAECHIDNDIYFTEGYIVAGKIWGRNVDELTQQCSSVAKASFGQNSSSGIRNIR